MDNSTLRAVLFFPRRVVWLILTFLVMTFIIFAFTRVGIDINLDKSFPPAVAENLREKYSLDQPLWKQYTQYLSDLLRGDFGPSLRSAQPVAGLIVQLLPSTGRLLGLAIVAGTVLSTLVILLGVSALWVRDRVPILGAIFQRLGQIGLTPHFTRWSSSVFGGFWLVLVG